jgi:hypothetical protein
MREKTDETDERADRWERREDTSRGKTDEIGEDNSGEGILIRGQNATEETVLWS